MQSLLVPLGMPNVRFVVELNPRKEPDSKGMDSVTFLFSANKNGTLQNVASVASGGEIARVMLSLKAMIAGAVKLPTIIFDEIDTGVSGSIAEKMALIMQEMGKQNRQVISVRSSVSPICPKLQHAASLIIKYIRKIRKQAPTATSAA